MELILTKKKRFGGIYVIIVLALLYLPILCVVLYSFNEAKTGAVFTGFTFSWYERLFANEKVIEAFYVSLKVGISASLLSCLIGTAAALAGNGLSSKIKSLMSNVLYIPLIIPEIIMAIAFLLFFNAAGIDNLLLSLKPYGVNAGIVKLVIAHSTFCTPYVYIMVCLRLNAIDKSITEAAADLGAGRRKVFTSVILPLIFPGIISGALLSMAMSLDDVVISIFVSGPSSLTLPVHIFSMMRLGVTPEINALCTVILVFTFTVVMLMNLLLLRRKAS